ncbi:pucI [Symbiodinium natans]|uniref:PucI protein n=1 Tax=Symbiodinium natans TaxID=878477 RepID=A0A812N3P9_9DINO|nr:pucI [Symbiodinium natans]
MLQCIGPTAQKMPLRKDQSCGVTCDVCGAEMKVGDLLPMRAYKPGASHLHKFVAYLSTECARKLLGKQTTTSKLLQKLRAIARHTQVMDLIPPGEADAAIRLPNGSISFADVELALQKTKWKNNHGPVNYEDDDVQFVLFNLSRFMELNMGDVYTSYARGQKKNVGPNMLVGLSNYRGGELWLFDERGDVYVKLPDTLPGAWRQRLFESANLKSGPAGEILVPGIAVDVRRRFVGFDGRWPHAVLPFEGERFSLVFFSRQLCQQFMQKLRRWNFNFPALLEIVPETLAGQAVGAFILAVGLALNAAPGVKYGIPFPVLARSSFGSGGAHFCTLTRGAVAIMWLSFQSWQGALGLYAALVRCVGEEAVHRWGTIDDELDAAKLIIFVVYLLMHAVLIQLGFQKLKRAISWALPSLVIGMGGIAVWAATLSPISEALEAAEEKGVDHIDGSNVVAFLSAVNSSLGSWSTLLLNVCDLSRFSPTQKDQVVGQSVGVPVPFLATLFVGMWVAGATKMAFGTAVWQLPTVFGYWHPVISALGAVVLAVGTLVVNLLANILSPINDIMNLAPKTFTYRGCGFFVLLLSFAVCPWWTFSGKVSFILSFLSGYAMVTGAIAGIFLCDYWILKARILDLQELYSATGVNWRALLSVAVGVAPCFPGFLDAIHAGDEGHASLVSPFWAHLYSGGSCLVSLAVSGTVFYLLNFVWPEGGARGKQESPASPLSSAVTVRVS